MKQGSGVLSARKKEFVKALAEHAAASFYAAQKARERSEQGVKERDFLLGLSHDMRAPGSRALCILRELRSGHLGRIDNEQAEQLHAAEKAICEQMQLLSDILDYAKHQKGFLQASICDIPLALGLGEILSSYSRQAKKKGLYFVCDEIPNGIVHCDQQHLRRMLENLLSNAVCYTESGGISISFASNEQSLDINIADTGSGH